MCFMSAGRRLAMKISTISLFKLSPDGKTATRVPVKVGRASVNAFRCSRAQGRRYGHLSDMSRWDKADRIRLE